MKEEYAILLEYKQTDGRTNLHFYWDRPSYTDSNNIERYMVAWINTDRQQTNMLRSKLRHIKNYNRIIYRVALTIWYYSD